MSARAAKRRRTTCVRPRARGPLRGRAGSWKCCCFPALGPGNLPSDASVWQGCLPPPLQLSPKPPALRQPRPGLPPVLQAPCGMRPSRETACQFSWPTGNFPAKLGVVVVNLLLGCRCLLMIIFEPCTMRPCVLPPTLARSILQFFAPSPAEIGRKLTSEQQWLSLQRLLTREERLTKERGMKREAVSRKRSRAASDQR